MQKTSWVQWKKAARRGVFSGTLAGLASAAVLAVCGQIENRRAASALNGPSQWLWGERAAHERRATLRHTVPGMMIHHLTSIGWATLHEHRFDASAQRKSALRHGIEAAGTTALAYFVDYHLTPKRLQPGFEKHLGKTSFFAVYASFGAGLALATLLRSRRKAL